MPSTLANQTPEPAADPIASVQAFETSPPQEADPPAQNDSQTASAETAPPKTAVSVADANAPAAAAQSEPLAPDPDQGAIVENLPTPQPEATPAAGQPQPKLQKTENKKALQPVPPASASQTDLGATAPGPDAPAPYTLQVGSYLTKSYAEDKMAVLTQKGYEPFIFEVTDAKQRKWHAVRFGQFETFKRATQSLSEFKDKEAMDGIIRRSDSP